MSSPNCSVAGALFGAAMLPLGLTGCIGPDFPTAEQSLCTVAGVGCRPECNATLMPNPVAEPGALTYHLGPAACTPVDWDDAARRADKLCRAQGLIAVAAATAIEPPVAPLPPAGTATFRCERRSS